MKQKITYLRKIERGLIKHPQAPKYYGCKTMYNIGFAFKKFIISYLIKEIGVWSIVVNVETKSED